MSGVALREIVTRGLAREVLGDDTTRVTGVQHDSRSVVAGDLFVAVRGGGVDGATFAGDAVARGARAVLAERMLSGIAVPIVVAPDARSALPHVASFVYGDPTSRLEVVGVTGTNGKTTTTFLIESVLRAAGCRSAVMGTVSFRLPGKERAAPHTTPEGDEIARFAREALDAGATHLVMEVSSHALALHRADAVHFAVAAYTNLTQDHLDFHGDLGAYAAAKARLFRELAPRAVVLNVDDALGARLAEEHGTSGRWRCSMNASAEAELRVLEWTMDRGGIRAQLAAPGGELSIVSPLVGAHNLENILVALGCGLALGLDAAKLTAGVAGAKGAPGRLERVDDPRDVAVFVDYAHTPDALARAIAALRPITPGRLVVVFGCGGDRDKGKRPLMGEAVARAADIAVVTSDNPRTEPPRAILQQITPGVERGDMGAIEGGAAALAASPRGYVVVEDRSEAIVAAIAAARAGDTVLIAGKGHEDYQIVGTTKRPFDDRDQARRAIAGAARGAG